MRPTMLLDTMSHSGSGSWGTTPTTETRTQDQAHDQPQDEAGTSTTTPASTRDAGGTATLTRREGREFASLVAGLLPCRSNDPELWFAEQAHDIEQAKAMCRECPLMAACLSGAIDRAEPWGVWGGEVFVDGVVVARKRGRGRPRKDAAA